MGMRQSDSGHGSSQRMTCNIVGASTLVLLKLHFLSVFGWTYLHLACYDACSRSPCGAGRISHGLKAYSIRLSTWKFSCHVILHDGVGMPFKHFEPAGNLWCPVDHLFFQNDGSKHWSECDHDLEHDCTAKRSNSCCITADLVEPASISCWAISSGVVITITISVQIQSCWRLQGFPECRVPRNTSITITFGKDQIQWFNPNNRLQLLNWMQGHVYWSTGGGGSGQMTKVHSHLFRPAKYGSGGWGFKSQCLRRNRLDLNFPNGDLLRRGVCLRVLQLTLAVVVQ